MQAVRHPLGQLDLGHHVLHVLRVDDPQLALRIGTAVPLLVELRLVKYVGQEPAVVFARRVRAGHEARLLGVDAPGHRKQLDRVVRVVALEDLPDRARVHAALDVLRRVGHPAGDERAGVHLGEVVDLGGLAEGDGEGFGRGAPEDVPALLHLAGGRDAGELEGDGREGPLVPDVRGLVRVRLEREVVIVESALLFLDVLRRDRLEGRHRQVAGLEDHGSGGQATCEHMHRRLGHTTLGTGGGRVPGVGGVEDEARVGLKPLRGVGSVAREDAEPCLLCRVVAEIRDPSDAVHRVQGEREIEDYGVVPGDAKVVHHLGRVDARHGGIERRRAGFVLLGWFDDGVPHERFRECAVKSDEFLRDGIDARMSRRPLPHEREQAFASESAAPGAPIGFVLRDAAVEPSDRFQTGQLES